MENSSDVDCEPRPLHPGLSAKAAAGTFSVQEFQPLCCGEEKHQLRPISASGEEGGPSDSMETHHPVTLAWKNIYVFVKGKTRKQKAPDVDLESGVSTKKNSGRKQIINNACGIVRPGTLVAIVGASGAGKSTLLNVLTNRNLKDYVVEGEITINGVAVGSGIRNVSAYVQQDELFMATLTVRETLKFRALLRMDQKLPKKARLQRVEEVIHELGLSKCADTRVGGIGGKRGISGGEAKRLSFACEMLTNPPLMFCDEPTSGLDSFMAQNVVQALQTMASKNHTILCTIHQPSSEVFAMFDRVLLMAEGRVAYMGSCTDAMNFLRSMNYVCPANFNPADFFVLTMAIIPGQEAECRKKVHAICNTFAESSEAKQIQAGIEELSARASSGSIDLEVAKEAKRRTIQYEASWGLQFMTVLWRSWISCVRDVFLFRVRIMQTVIVSVVIGLLYLRLDYDQKGVMDINGGIFMLIAQTSMVNLFAVINSFPVEIALFLREYGSGMYRADVYYFAKSIAELPTFILLPILSMSIDYWMMGLYESAEAFLVAAGVAVLIANVAMSFGHLMSTVAGSVSVALALGPPLLMPLLMFGGFFINTDSIPVYFIWLRYISWFNYANELLIVNQWENVDSIACDVNTTAAAVSASEMGPRCLFLNGQNVMDYLSFSADNRWLDLGLMFALLAGFRIFAFIFLLVRARLAKT